MQVVGAVYIDSTGADISIFWIVMFIMTEIISKITMEMFSIATIRDWIIEVLGNVKTLPRHNKRSNF